MLHVNHRRGIGLRAHVPCALDSHAGGSVNPYTPATFARTNEFERGRPCACTKRDAIGPLEACCNPFSAAPGDAPVQFFVPAAHAAQNMYRELLAAVAIKLLSGCHARCSSFCVRSGASGSAAPFAARFDVKPLDRPKRLDDCTATESVFAKPFVTPSCTIYGSSESERHESCTLHATHWATRTSRWGYWTCHVRYICTLTGVGVCSRFRCGSRDASRHDSGAPSRLSTLKLLL